MKMMKSLFRFSIILIMLFACKREKVDFLGPAYISAPEGFAVISFTATSSSVDFTSNKVLFNATFTNSVSWILTITGQKSGAVRYFSGISNSLTNIEWSGSHDGVAFFRQGETVTATLSFYGTSYVSSTTLDIINVPDYTTCGAFAKYGDFETPSKISSLYKWQKNTSANSFQGPIFDSMAVDYNGNLVPSVQGIGYYTIKGLGDQSSYVAGFQYGGKSAVTTFSNLPTDPNNVWVNIYVYGTGDANSMLEVHYWEEDKGGKSTGYQDAEDDAYIAQITADHKGWKLFSFQYSKLPVSIDPAFGGSGNKIQEPDKLKGFVIVLLKKSNPNKAAEVYFDYPIITEGGPFKPCK